MTMSTGSPRCSHSTHPFRHAGFYWTLFLYPVLSPLSPSLSLPPTIPSPVYSDWRRTFCMTGVLPLCGTCRSQGHSRRSLMASAAGSSSPLEIHSLSLDSEHMVQAECVYLTEFLSLLRSETAPLKVWSQHPSRAPNLGRVSFFPMPTPQHFLLVPPPPQIHGFLLWAPL